MYANCHHLFDNSTDAGGGIKDEVSRMNSWLTVAIIGMIFVLILCTMIIRDGTCKHCGIMWCEGRPVMPETIQQQREEEQEEDQQRLTPDQKKELQLKQQRQERQLWYSYYLRPFITVLTAEHFQTRDKRAKQDCREEEKQGEAGEDRQITGKLEVPAKVSPEKCADVDGLEACQDADHATDTTDTGSSEPKHEKMLLCQPVSAELSEDHGGQPTKTMTLWYPHDASFRSVEAECTICLLEYEEGDTIVRSAADEKEEVCTHVFHLECMLQWLTQGKKRCPICRHWFVPAIRIKEQMKQAQVMTRASLHHLYDARTMENITSLRLDTESDISGSFGSTQTADIELGAPAPIHQETRATPEEAPAHQQASHQAPSHQHRASTLAYPSGHRQATGDLESGFGFASLPPARPLPASHLQEYDT